ncbi:hypothetical protein [Cellulomonas sp. S1-8]|uniref:hypothetical protein n=1 Tax=Cellulomonas sp. S1-8 TaxID=2904790 RepID=UPI002242C850|nr:hypothetical protein [Cellulomonas sp. S1-8]UZN03074.1 hypothetical protein OKX07_18795 [Cellulomonas sp. S1-8]
MSSLTTVRMPRALRDRLAIRARANDTTLAGTLEQLLDATEEQEFWAAVRVSNARVEHVPGAPDALRDGLDNADDDALGANGW